MKGLFFGLLVCLTLVFMACSPVTQYTTDTPPSSISVKSSNQAPTPTALQDGNVLWVKNAENSGADSLRQVLADAQPYDTIKFDPNIFLPQIPLSIFVEEDRLPFIDQNKHHLTIDASDAGVIIDGSHLPGSGWNAFTIYQASGVTIRGLQISHFSGPAISINEESQFNLIEGNRLTENQTGIDLISVTNMNNTITNNLIGIGIGRNVQAGNYKRGIAIYEGSHNNTIGPGNQIAFNGPDELSNLNDGCGVFIENSDGFPASFGNTITQNSIHDNKGDGICLVDHVTQQRDGPNEKIRAPFILSVDMAQNFVRGITGITCPGCTIEVFSTQDGEEGEVYEGSTQACDDGTFTFQKTDGAARCVLCEYDNVVVTATDMNHNTSEFSKPGGYFRVHNPSEILQGENNNQTYLILTKPSYLLEDNHISVWLDTYSEYRDTDFVIRNGFKRIHIASLTGQGQDVWGTIIDENTITDEVDNAIDEYHKKGVKVVLMLAASGSGLEAYGYLFRPGSGDFENNYLPYITFVANHFKNRIPVYEIWNEPVNINPLDYITLVQQSVPVIRGIDSNAKITIGSIHGINQENIPGYGNELRGVMDAGYLNYILKSNLADPMVDGISWHPYIGVLPADQFYQEYPEIVKGIKALAESHGFTGEYFGDDMLWGTVREENWSNGPLVSFPVAAKMYTRSITEHRGLGVNVTFNPFFQKTFMSPLRNINTVLAGAEPADIPISLETTAENVRHYSFVLPDGSRLVALWTNGDAVDADPGINADLTFPGSIAHRVVGIDVFNGFEQEMNIETSGGNLVINNLMIKDYPIFLRLEGWYLRDPADIPPEPVSIQLKQGAHVQVPAGTPIQFTTNWVARTENQVQDFLHSATISGHLYGILEGQDLYDLNDYWGPVVPYPRSTTLFTPNFYSQWTYPFGMLNPGDYTLKIQCFIGRPVTDGFDANHDGTPDTFSGQVWTYTIPIEVY